MDHTMNNAVEMARKFDAAMEEARAELGGWASGIVSNGFSSPEDEFIEGQIRFAAECWIEDNETDMDTIEQGRAWDMGR